jgi:hypothetical protein
MTQIIGLEPTRQGSPEEWTIRVDCPEVAFLRDRYHEIPEEEFNEMLRSATGLLSKCPNPKTKSGQKTGIAIGKVQSGKTLSFTTLIALATANGYSRIIVLAGTKKALRDQTAQRFKRDLRISDPAYTSRILLYTDPTTYNLDAIRNANSSTVNKSVLLVVLKTKKRIQDVKELLSSPELPTAPTLIIDDEGDEASLNTYFRSGKQSATYKSILDLRKTLPLNSYIAYTATPQANLLLQTIDQLSPEFCAFIEPGTGYCGGSLFFGDRSGEFIREIKGPTDEESQKKVTDDLREALSVFFVGAAIRHIRSEGAKHTMLMHVSHLKDVHETLTGNVQAILRKWTDALLLKPKDPSRVGLLKFFTKAYGDLTARMSSPPSWDKVESRLLRELQSSELHMVNSLPRGVQIAESTFQHENNIVIGGNILSRGVTIRDLAVSYITRRADNTNADTMEQRGRWFGYKSEYLDLCRIYLPRQINMDFQEILRFEDDFWESMKRTLRQNLPIRDWPRIFKLNPELGLSPTRSSVANFYKFKPEGWKTQRKPVNPSVVQENINSVKQFFSSHNEKNEKIGSAEHTFIRDCDVRDVITNLLEKLNLDGTGWESSYYVEYLIRLVQSGKLNKMDVVLMRKGGWQERTFENNEINQLMVGHSSNYVGDREFHEEKVQLQVYFIQKKQDENVKTTALALHIPKNENFNLSYIVRDESL